MKSMADKSKMKFCINQKLHFSSLKNQSINFQMKYINRTMALSLNSNN